MIETMEDDRDDQEYLTNTSTLEALMIQALMNQLSEIVTDQNKKKRISYDNSFKQAETLRSLAQTALMLSDSESLHLHGEKIQDFLNRAILENTLHRREMKDAEPKPQPTSETEGA